MSALLRRRRLAGVALLVVAAVVAVLAFWLVPREGSRTVTAYFTRAVGLYPGSDVRVLGVRVGTVRSVQPDGTRVKVVLEVDGDQKVPRDAKAAVLAPSLVSDRYVQLLPAWTGGPTLQDGATIPVERTAVPVELDRITESLDDLNLALGPEGANKDGSLSRLLDTSARNLDGNGERLNGTIRDTSKALEALNGGGDDLFGTVKNLQTFTSTLARNDSQVRRLNTDLASVSDQLSGERDDLALALRNLAVALGEVSTFVRDNRQVLTEDVNRLASVTGTVAKQRDALTETLQSAPVALSNLQNAYSPRSGTLDTRNNAEQFHDPVALLCSYVTGTSGNPQGCRQIRDALAGLRLTGAAPGVGSIPLDLLSPVPASAELQAPGRPAPGVPVQVDRRGPDPTLAGILGGAR